MSEAGKQILFISFPRTGHHRLVELLLKYYADDPATVETSKAALDVHRGLLRGGDLTYCEHYSHCKTVPCPDPATTLQKSHDFGLKIDAPPDQKCIVAVRNPVESLASLFRFYVDQGKQNPDYRGWVDFLHRRMGPRGFVHRCLNVLRESRLGLRWRAGKLRRVREWRGLYQKWLVQHRSRRLIVRYADLVADPASVLREAIGFITPDNTINEQRIASIATPSSSKRVTGFEYFDLPLFRAIESSLAPEMEAAGLAPLL